MNKFLSRAFWAFTIFFTLPLTAPAALPDDKHWDNQFGPPGVNAQAYGIAAIGNKIYVVGVFTAAGNTEAWGAAGFDGTNWFPLNGGLPGGGVDPVVICAAADNNYLYAGGIFTNADDPTANDTARWDGTTWAGVGIQGLIETAKRNGSNLYFGGVFSGSTNITSTNIIGWDGTNWFALGSGLGGNGFNPFFGSVNCLAFQGNNVYAGGNFSYSGGTSMTNIAYWDGTAWHAMGNPFNGTVDALQFYGGYLYAGGGFTNSTLHLTNIARWDGSVWSAVPGGGGNDLVSDFATDGTNLYVGGYFTQIGGIAASNVCMFNGSTWTSLGTGLHFFQTGLGQVNKLLWWSNQLYVAGGFDRAGNVSAANVARWDGAHWWSLGGDTSKGMAASLNFVQTLCNVPGSGSIPAGLYAGGLFAAAGKTNVNSIARYDGTNWNALGSGVSGWPGAARVYAIATDGTYVYAGGSFTNAGSYTNVGSIAEWDGNNWYPLYYGVDYRVNALAADAFGYLWVGGAFTNINNAGPSKGLAIWGFGSWYSLPNGSVDGTNATVNAIVFDGGTRVYMGGQFYSVDGVSATNIAYYDFSDGNVHPLGLGLNNQVNALAYSNGKLYAGGSFTQAGSLTVNHVAQWDGANWSAIGNGLTGSSSANVLAIAVAGTNVYVGGQNFTNASGVIVSNIAVWNGSSWSSLGSGTEYGRNCSALAASGNDVYAGGNFNWAGDKPSQFIAHWNSQSNYYPAANIQLTRTLWQTNRQFRFRVTGTSGQSYIIQATTNFMSWTSLETNSTMFYDFSDANSASYPARFYRAILEP